MEERKYKTKFKKWCVENRLSARTVANEIGCSRKSVYSYMQGDRYPSRKIMRRMEEKLGIDTRQMFGI